MKILALDLATATGVAVGDTSDRPWCHTERLSDAGASHGARFRACMLATKKLVRQHEPDVIALEQAVATVMQGSPTRLHVALGLRASVLAMADYFGLRVEEYAVSTVRKHFIGHGKMKGKDAKAAVIARCNKLGWIVENDNEADAAAVWDYARAVLDRKFTPTPNGLFDERADTGAGS